MKLTRQVLFVSVVLLSTSVFAEQADPNRNNVDFVSEGTETLFPIAIIDSGVDYTHPELHGKLHHNTDTTNLIIDDYKITNDLHGYDFNEDDDRAFDNNYAGYVPQFQDIKKAKKNLFDFLGAIGHNSLEFIKTIMAMGSPGHGTHVSGIVLKECANTCSIVPIKVFGSNPPILKRLAAAIEYSQLRGYKIVNMSLGVDSRYFKTADKSESVYLEKIKKIMTESTDTLFIVAAGNNGLSLSDPSQQIYPAAFNLPNMITVGAVDNSGVLASFSNFDSKMVHVFAPGVDIDSTWNDGLHKVISGTSMSTPYVAGTLAKLWVKHPGFSAQELKTHFLNQIEVRSVEFKKSTYQVPVLLDSDILE